MSSTVPNQIALDPLLAKAAQAAKRGGFVDFLGQYFYFSMSLLIAAVVAWGFGHTIGTALIHRQPPAPWILYAHAFAFCGWVVFFILQSALVRTHNVKVHRKLGWFGLGLGSAMILLGVGTAVTMVRASVVRTHSTEGANFLIIPFFDITCFAFPFLLAIYWRKKPEFDLRLILIASCALTSAAFGRFPHLSFLAVYPLIDLMLLFGVARDWLVNRRVHPVYLYALPVLAASQFFVLYTLLHQSPWWVKIAHAIAG